jgi:hypothetical protein
VIYPWLAFKRKTAGVTEFAVTIPLRRRPAMVLNQRLSQAALRIACKHRLPPSVLPKISIRQQVGGLRGLRRSAEAPWDARTSAQDKL